MRAHSSDGHEQEVRPIRRGGVDDAEQARWLPNRNPSSGESWATISEAGAADVHSTVLTARRTFEDGLWSDLPGRDRARVLFGLAEILDANEDLLATCETNENGKPLRQTKNQVAFAASIYRYYGA